MGENVVAQIVEEAKKRMQVQGEFSRDMIPDLVDELIYEFRHDGHITDDENVEALRAEVEGRLRQEFE